MRVKPKKLDIKAMTERAGYSYLMNIDNPGRVFGCGPEHVGDAGLRRVQRSGDRVERQVRRSQPELLPRRSFLP